MTEEIKKETEEHSELTCEDAQNLVPAFVRGNVIGNDQKKKLEAHLMKCKNCRLLYWSLAKEYSKLKKEEKRYEY